MSDFRKILKLTMRASIWPFLFTTPLTTCTITILFQRVQIAHGMTNTVTRMISTWQLRVTTPTTWARFRIPTRPKRRFMSSDTSNGQFELTLWMIKFLVFDSFHCILTGYGWLKICIFYTNFYVIVTFGSAWMWTREKFVTGFLAGWARTKMTRMDVRVVTFGFGRARLTAFGGISFLFSTTRNFLWGSTASGRVQKLMWGTRVKKIPDSFKTAFLNVFSKR